MTTPGGYPDDTDPITGLSPGNEVHDVDNPISFYLHDHLGNTRVIFRAEKEAVYAIEYAADYFPFGKIQREYLPCERERFLTTHHERDRESGYDNRGARLYDSEIGRFMGVDPLASQFPGWSPYNYVLGNPVSLTDPTGASPEGGIVTKTKDDDGNTTLTITATVYIYGDQADADLASTLQGQINSAWSGDGAQATYGGKEYQVVANITVQAVSADEAAALASENTDGSVNFLRVFEGGAEGKSGSAFKGNSGKLDLTQNTSTAGTTAPHEIGHMLGFRNDGPTPFGDETHFSSLDGNGNLPMMYSGGAVRNDNGDVIAEVSSRSVTRSDVNGLRLNSGLMGSRRRSKKLGGAVTNKILRTPTDINDFKH